VLSPKQADSDHNLYSSSEERLNTISHAIAALFALVGLILLVKLASSPMQVGIAWIYGISLVTMFSASSAYHYSSKPALRTALRKLDHIAIYLLIAGTYTPFLALSVGGKLGNIGLVVIWLVAAIGIAFKLILGHRFPKISIAAYAIMGWLALLLIYPIYQSVPLNGFILLIGGGLLYSLGIPFYMLKSRHFSHAIWHIFVAAGALCHFLAIYKFVYPI